MELQNTKGDLAMQLQTHKQSDIERKLRMQSMISVRGLDISPVGKLGESIISDDPLINTERILEERLDREESLAREVKYMDKQLNELERDL